MGLLAQPCSAQRSQALWQLPWRSSQTLAHHAQLPACPVLCMLPSAAPKPSPEEAAGWVSRMLYAYANPLIKLGSVKHLEQDDLWELMREDRAAVVHASFQEELAKTVDPVSAPQVRTIAIGTSRDGGWKGCMLYYSVTSVGTSGAHNCHWNHTGWGLVRADTSARMCNWDHVGMG